MSATSNRVGCQDYWGQKLCLEAHYKPPLMAIQGWIWGHAVTGLIFETFVNDFDRMRLNPIGDRR